MQARHEDALAAEQRVEIMRQKISEAEAVAAARLQAVNDAEAQAQQRVAAADEKVAEAQSACSAAVAAKEKAEEERDAAKQVRTCCTLCKSLTLSKIQKMQKKILIKHTGCLPRSRYLSCCYTFKVCLLKRAVDPNC
jgi:hypothetical protein